VTTSSAEYQTAQNNSFLQFFYVILGIGLPLCVIIPIAGYFIILKYFPNSNLGKKIIEWKRQHKER